MADSTRDEMQDLVGDLMGKLVSKSRKGLKAAAATGRERLERRQARKDLDDFWIRLGKTAYRLTEGGAIDHPALQKAMTRIQELEARIEELG